MHNPTSLDKKEVENCLEIGVHDKFLSSHPNPSPDLSQFFWKVMRSHKLPNYCQMSTSITDTFLARNVEMEELEDLISKVFLQHTESYFLESFFKDPLYSKKTFSTQDLSAFYKKVKSYQF